MNFEEKLVRNFRLIVLQATGNNRSATARILGVSQRTIARFCKANAVAAPAKPAPEITFGDMTRLEKMIRFGGDS